VPPTITHRKDAVYPATIVGIPPMEDFYIGGASVKLFLPANAPSSIRGEIFVELPPTKFSSPEKAAYVAPGGASIRF
jgi:3-polyprenyl-4-hydroxybenzoate decarboxylase